ncbi:MAG: hypothetical protein LKJ75_02645 [Clostridia bacterium]|jgi:uncharacterized membrane-anchored protein YhcB (DUF1043 family)|nr:hypothetical protein [Clostridia bacterium]MCI2014083.1 hypothetical protein [Clostridia bacterium]
MNDERNLDLNRRAEDTRENSKSEVVKFKLDEIKQHFDDNIKAIKDQFNIAQELILEDKRQNAEDIWRSQVVFLESAFDFYLHELTKFGLYGIFEGTPGWKETDKYNNIEVKMSIVEGALSSGKDSKWFLEFINGMYSGVTMTSFESFKAQMNLIGINIMEIANEAFYVQGANEKTMDKLKRRINELYHRRNLIAHQSDREHANAKRNEISKDLVKDFVKDFEKIVNAINKVTLIKAGQQN